MGELVVAVCAKVWKSAGFLVCGGAAEADLWRGGGKVSSGRIRGAVERVRGLRERQEARLAGVVIPGGGGGSRFHDRRARAGSKGRALRDFAALCLLAVSCGISRAVARTVTRNFEPAARKMTGVRWSHLMHPMNQVHKMSDS